MTGLTPEQLDAIFDGGAAWVSEVQFEQIRDEIDRLRTALDAAEKERDEATRKGLAQQESRDEWKALAEKIAAERDTLKAREKRLVALLEHAYDEAVERWHENAERLSLADWLGHTPEQQDVFVRDGVSALAEQEDEIIAGVRVKDAHRPLPKVEGQ